MLSRQLSLYVRRFAVCSGKLTLLIISLTVLTSFYFFTSIVFYSWIRYNVLPNQLVAEPLVFNYNEALPSANVNLFSPQRCRNTSQHISIVHQKQSPEKEACSPFLRSATSYAISVDMIVALPYRKRDAGTFMMSIVILDGSGKTIATSSRPVTMPSQSYMSLLFGFVTNFPIKLSKMVAADHIEGTLVHVNLIDDFLEPADSQPPTKSLAIVISTHEVSILSSTLTLVPKLGGIAYYLYHHPKKMLVISVTLLTLVQLLVTICVAIWISVWRALYTDPQKDSEAGEKRSPSVELSGRFQKSDRSRTEDARLRMKALRETPMWTHSKLFMASDESDVHEHSTRAGDQEERDARRIDADG